MDGNRGAGDRLKVIMLTSLQDKEIIVRSFLNGAHNYITKASYKDIVQAIRDAHASRPALHPDAVPALVKEIQLVQLTPSERELYELREQGLSRNQISKTLNKSINTIYNAAAEHPGQTSERQRGLIRFL